MKALTLCLLAISLFCGNVPAQQPAPEFSREYDRFKDVTKVTLKPYPLNKDKKLTVSIFAGGMYAGETPSTPPEAVGFGIHIATKGGSIVNPKSTELQAIVDGERVDFGELEVVTLDGVPSNDHSVAFMAVIPFRTLQKIAAAQKVEMRFSGVEFYVTEDARSALGRFIHQISK